GLSRFADDGDGLILRHFPDKDGAVCTAGSQETAIAAEAQGLDGGMIASPLRQLFAADGGVDEDTAVPLPAGDESSIRSVGHGGQKCNLNRNLQTNRSGGALANTQPIVDRGEKGPSIRGEGRGQEHPRRPWLFALEFTHELSRFAVPQT